MIHATAEVHNESDVGSDTKVWHNAQIRENATVGMGCNIGKGVYIDKNVRVGDNCKIQNYACLYQGLLVEDDVFIGPHVCFTNDKKPRVKGHWKITPTHVKKGASIGANATIVCGITIGCNAMVGAGSVVVSDVPDNATVVGNPAKILGWGGGYDPFSHYL